MMNFNVNIPRDNLRCMICNLVNRENDNPMYTDYCRNKLKYRKFLEEIPEAMAAPKDLNAGSIYVIVANDLFKSPNFQDHCTARDTLYRYIQIVKILDSISDSIYKKCLLNTVEYKLGPQWNKVGQYLVEGPNFLSSIGNINAIKLNIDIRNNNARFKVTPSPLDLPLLRRQANRDFQLPYSVKVLPSLADARVVRRWEAIQEEHPFEDYKDLREYWRKMHGYILPDYEEGLLFYDVEFFLPNEPPTMVYPETCLILRQKICPLKPYSLENHFLVNVAPGIYRRFVENLRERVSTLCGQQLVYPEV